MQASRMNNTMSAGGTATLPTPASTNAGRGGYGAIMPSTTGKNDVIADESSPGSPADIETEAMPLLQVTLGQGPRSQYGSSPPNSTNMSKGDNEYYAEASSDQRRVLQMLDDTIAQASTNAAKSIANSHNGTRNGDHNKNKNKGEYAVWLPNLTLEEVIDKRNESSSSSSGTDVDHSCWGCLQQSMCGSPILTTSLVIVLSCLLVHYILPLQRTMLGLSDSVFMLCIYPGMVAIITCAGSSRQISTRIYQYSYEIAFWCSGSSMSSSTGGNPNIKQLIIDAIEEQIVVRVTSIVELIDINMGMSMENIATELHPLTSKRHLEQYNNNNNKPYSNDSMTMSSLVSSIPKDPAHFVESELQDATEELKASVLQFEQDEALTDDKLRSEMWIPSNLLTPQSYYSSVIWKIQIVFWISHLVIAYTTAWIVGMFVVPFTPIMVPIEDELHDVIEPMIDDVISAPMLTWIALLALESYIWSCCYVGVVVYQYHTSPRHTVHVVNDLRRNIISPRVTLLLKQHGITFLCQDILQTRMERTRSKFLFLIHQLHRIKALYDDWGPSTATSGQNVTGIVGYDDEDSNNPPDDSSLVSITSSIVTDATNMSSWASIMSKTSPTSSPAASVVDEDTEKIKTIWSRKRSKNSFSM